MAPSTVVMVRTVVAIVVAFKLFELSPLVTLFGLSPLVTPTLSHNKCRSKTSVSKK